MCKRAVPYPRMTCGMIYFSNLAHTRLWVEWVFAIRCCGPTRVFQANGEPARITSLKQVDPDGSCESMISTERNVDFSGSSVLETSLWAASLCTSPPPLRPPGPGFTLVMPFRFAACPGTLSAFNPAADEWWGPDDQFVIDQDPRVRYTLDSGLISGHWFHVVAPCCPPHTRTNTSCPP